MPFSFKLSEPPCDAYYLSLIDAAALYKTDDAESGTLKHETLRQVGWHEISTPTEWYTSDKARDTTRNLTQLLQCTIQYLHYKHKSAERQLRRVSEARRICMEERDAAFEELVRLRETVAVMKRRAGCADRDVPYRARQTHGPVADDAQRADGDYSCALCGNQYPTPHSLRSHMQKRHARDTMHAPNIAARTENVEQEQARGAPPSESPAVAHLRDELTAMREMLMQFIAQQQQSAPPRHPSPPPAPAATNNGLLLPFSSVPSEALAVVSHGDAAASSEPLLRELRGALAQVNTRLSHFEHTLTELAAAQGETARRLAMHATKERPQPLSLSALHVHTTTTTPDRVAVESNSPEVLVSPTTEASHSAFRGTAHTTALSPVTRTNAQAVSVAVPSAAAATVRTDTGAAAVHTPHVLPAPEPATSPPHCARTASKTSRVDEKELPGGFSVHNGSALSRSGRTPTPVMTPLQSHLGSASETATRARHAEDAAEDAVRTTSASHSAPTSPLAPPSMLEIRPQSTATDDKATTGSARLGPKPSAAHSAIEDDTVHSFSVMMPIDVPGGTEARHTPHSPKHDTHAELVPPAPPQTRSLTSPRTHSGDGARRATAPDVAVHADESDSGSYSGSYTSSARSDRPDDNRPVPAPHNLTPSVELAKPRVTAPPVTRPPRLGTSSNVTTSLPPRSVSLPVSRTQNVAPSLGGAPAEAGPKKKKRSFSASIKRFFQGKKSKKDTK